MYFYSDGLAEGNTGLEQRELGPDVWFWQAIIAQCRIYSFCLSGLQLPHLNTEMWTISKVPLGSLCDSLPGQDQLTVSMGTFPWHIGRGTT